MSDVVRAWIILIPLIGVIIVFIVDAPATFKGAKNFNDFYRLAITSAIAITLICIVLFLSRAHAAVSTSSFYDP